MKTVILVFSFFVINLPAVSGAEVIGNFFAGSLKNAKSAKDLFKKEKIKIESMSPRHFQYTTDELYKEILKIGSWIAKNSNFHMQVGDIAGPKGGKLGGHISHQTGLGVDIGYIPKKLVLKGHRFKKYQNKFTQVFENKKGILPSFDTKLHISLLRFIQQNVDVRKVYVGCWIYNELIGELSKDDPIRSFLRVDLHHEDHFHLRLNCPRSQPNCSHIRPKKKKRKRKKKSSKKTGWCYRNPGWVKAK